MSLFRSVGEICDVISILVHCPTDGTLLLALESATSEFWLPTSKVTPGNSWSKQASQDIREIFGNDIFVNKILRLFQLWVPNHKYPHIHYCVFEIGVSEDEKKQTRNVSGRYKGKIRWVNEAELRNYGDNHNLRSSEILDFCVFSKKVVVVGQLFYDQADGFLQTGNLLELDQSVLISGRTSIYENIVEAAGFDRSIQEALYKEFLLLCFPACYMSLRVFSKIIIDMGWMKEESESLFRSADLHARNGLSFREFLYFLAVVEPTTNHGGPAAELRCRYIFRYFDYDKNNLLKLDEFKNFIHAIRKSKKLPLDAASVSRECTEQFKIMGLSETHSITVGQFLKAIGELKIRGTSQIFRSPISIKKYIEQMDRNTRSLIASSSRRTLVTRDSLGRIGKITATPYLKFPEFDLAVHTIRIQKSGTAINVDQLVTLDNAVSMSSTRQPTLSEANRRQSLDQFSQSSETNEILRALRYLIQLNKNMPPYLKGQPLQYQWGQLDPNSVAKRLVNICTQVKTILMKEARLLDLKTPLYIMGDLHGNFGDLLCFEKIFWHVGPGLCPCNLLFLGDYVDRGAFSFEVISYLFCYKLQSPHKVSLIRGNHEIKRIQMQWTFERECRIKFGEKVGQDLFNAINDAFDVMPLAAVIDGRIFCCHGGIPPPWLCPVVTAINDIPVILNEPQEQSQLAWELMWNDPARNKHINDKTAMELLTNEGFATNARRGTAHIFTVEALERFLKTNGFTHLIRAHEVVEAGFNVQQRGKLITIFSTSKYCGGQNEAACIFAIQGKIRVLRLET